MKTPQPACPECEKLNSISDKSKIIGEFLDYLQSDTNIELCEWEHGRYFQHQGGIERLLAQYFDIDLDKVEQERRAFLDWLREEQK